MRLPLRKDFRRAAKLAAEKASHVARQRSIETQKASLKAQQAAAVGLDSPAWPNRPQQQGAPVQQKRLKKRLLKLQKGQKNYGREKKSKPTSKKLRNGTRFQRGKNPPAGKHDLTHQSLDQDLSKPLLIFF